MHPDQACVPDEVCPLNILSINRIYEVSGHFFSSALDKNAIFCHFTIGPACISMGFILTAREKR
jgi:hypothetical protein